MPTISTSSSASSTGRRAPARTSGSASVHRPACAGGSRRPVCSAPTAACSASRRRAGRWAGSSGSRAPGGGPATSTCWTLAIGLVPAVRGRGIGTRAQRLLAAYLFDHTRAERLQAWTDCANLAEQRALEKAGFVREGVLRSAQWRGGRWHDQVIFSMLRAELPGSEPGT
ncbi:GNAT family protein [Streptomyces sp. NPDC005727]|uniref:GNAT family N-acetyltransferase n=1 Tax=Streptomyces sp. NPDC005727 TaxID=3157053 RepID=UPI0033E4B0A2